MDGTKLAWQLNAIYALIALVCTGIAVESYRRSWQVQESVSIAAGVGIALYGAYFAYTSQYDWGGYFIAIPAFALGLYTILRRSITRVGLAAWVGVLCLFIAAAYSLHTVVASEGTPSAMAESAASNAQASMFFFSGCFLIVFGIVVYVVSTVWEDEVLGLYADGASGVVLIAYGAIQWGPGSWAVLAVGCIGCGAAMLIEAAVVLERDLRVMSQIALAVRRYAAWLTAPRG